MKKLAVIVGRFQVPELHKGHLALFEEGKWHRRMVVICRGEANMSQRYPLPYTYVASMIKEYCFPLLDNPSDEAWSNLLDIIIDAYKNEDETPMLIVGRDSFKDRYSGKYEVEQIDEVPDVSGTAVREAIKLNYRPDFAKGIIFAHNRRHPVAYHTVDMACIKEVKDIDYGPKRNVVLLGKKNGKWRFPGGFVDPKDDTIEMAAYREMREEVDIEATDVKYICSMKIDDWRYRGEKDKIITSFFRCKYAWGGINAKEEFDEVLWFDIKKKIEDIIAEEHIPLWKALQEEMK